jgi:GNAT superfamily N-acetyltransferase
LRESPIVLRNEPVPADRETVRRIVESSGFFHPYEVDTAVELVDERLAKGLASGYHFVFADRGVRTAGYACFGPIACTAWSWDFYWLAVDQPERGGGVGKALLREVEARIAGASGRRIYVETSSRPLYEPTRAFYERHGYVRASVLEDFYGPGDSKVTYVKVLPGASAGPGVPALQGDL